MTYLLLGKTGDIISVLPLLHVLASKGEPPTLVVAEEYAPLLEGVTYVRPAVWSGKWTDLRGAMTWARQKVDPAVISLQVAGTTEDVKEFTYVHKPHRAVRDSFEREMWDLAGRLDLWKEQPPLVFDCRSEANEAALLAKFPQPRGAKKFRCLYHLAGDTSPFPYAKLLLKLLRLQFPRWEMIDLGAIQSPRIYDFIALMETADLLVACDSAFLHLARAVRDLSVVALVKDTPTFWHGTAWTPQHVRHCRYSDFPARAVEIVECLIDASKWTHVAEAGKLIYHVFSEYEVNGQAVVTPLRMFPSPVEIGAPGRDSRSALKDKTRFPFVRDVLRLASMRASADDILCLTRPSVQFADDASNVILEKSPCYAPNLFAFSKAWWQEHQLEMPDMVMGMDDEWQKVLAEIVKKHGGTEAKEVLKP